MTLRTDITKPSSLGSTRRPHVSASLGGLNEAEQQDNFGERMIDSKTELPSFRAAELRSECARVMALLSVFAGLLATLVLSRGIMSLMQEHRGAGWPFVGLLAAMTAYEVVWLRFVKRAIGSRREISTATWTGSIFIESLLPTIAVLLQLYSAFPGPGRALTSPVVLAYFIFIVLSTLHLSPHLSRLTGVFAATGYASVSIYAFLLVPEAVSSDTLWDYTISFSYSAFMLIAGFAAGSVAAQIRTHVIVALDEARGLAKLEQDLSLARTIQQGLLPKASPNVDGFDIGGWNKPADETGGDYFDWQQLADGRLALTIADVTGHGIGSAIGMADCRAYARAGFAAGTELSHFLIYLNQLLHNDLPSDKFVTLVAGLLNPKDATLDLISAGHGPLLFYSSQE
ncbi:MAG: SpoIIE family protein phosphatase, partial [Bryobacteraceae bacterium]